MNTVFASVAPVLMAMLIGVVLPTQAAGMTFGGSVWLGITTVRVLRKVSPGEINYHLGHAHLNFFYLVLDMAVHGGCLVRTCCGFHTPRVTSSRQFLDSSWLGHTGIYCWTGRFGS